MLLVNGNLIAGGIETALISFVENMKNVFDIDVMLFANEGILKDKLSQDVKVIEGGKIMRQLYHDHQIRSEATINSRSSLKAILKNILVKLGAKKIVSKFALVGHKNKNNYDIAVCYNGMSNLIVKYTLNKVKAYKKISVIHSDVAHFNLTKRQIKNLGKFDKIVCVSNSCANIMKDKYPVLNDKIDYIYNFQNRENIIALTC